MSQFCPLCGKNKSGKALFCDDCKNKIEKEYEVDVPEENKSTDPTDYKQTDIKPESTENKSDVKEQDENLTSEITPVSIKPQRNKRNWFIWLLILGVLLVVGFFYYGQVVRKANLDRSQWDAAVKENTVSGYLTYMQAFPKGKYCNLAEEFDEIKRKRS